MPSQKLTTKNTKPDNHRERWRAPVRRQRKDQDNTFIHAYAHSLSHTHSHSEYSRHPLTYSPLTHVLSLSLSHTHTLPLFSSSSSRRSCCISFIAAARICSALSSRRQKKCLSSLSRVVSNTKFSLLRSFPSEFLSCCRLCS